MLIPLRDVLEMPSFRAAEVAVLSGDPDTVAVRWVHSSEVYEMGGLLAGGEVLLTTGLGLHGRTGDQLAAYVDQIADAGCAALAMEVGRSFFEIPRPMVEAARRRGFVLFALGAVVPFERMAEDFHNLLLRHKTGSMAGGEPLWRDFLAVVVAGEGMRVLLDAISRAAGCVVEFHDVEGRLVERSRIASRESSEQLEVEVRGPRGPRGRLVLRAGETRRRMAVADRAAVAVALELGRAPDLGRRPTVAHSVVNDLAAGVLVSRGDVARRLSEAGWGPHAEDNRVVVVAIDAGAAVPVDEVVAATEECWTGLGRARVVGAVGSHVVLLLEADPRVAPQRLRAALTEDTRRLQSFLEADAPPLVGVATPVADLAQTSRAVGAAREVVRSAQKHGVRRGVVMARDVGVQRLLSEVPAASVTDLVTEQIGALIEQDRAHGADLVRTLGVYLARGMSKTATADLLGIRRQSLYARLERIERLLGISLADPAHRAGLDLALTAWQMRTGADPQTAFASSVR